MRLPRCIYSDGSPLGGSLQSVYEQLRTLSERNVDGWNIATNTLGDGLSWSTPSFPLVETRRIVNNLADTVNPPYIRKKGSGVVTAPDFGLEFIVDAADSDEGRVCILDKDYLSRQLISLIPQDPATGNEGGTLSTPRGNLTLTGNSIGNIILGLTTRPGTTNTIDLGTSSLGFRELFTRTIDTDGAQTLTFQTNNVNRITIDSGGLVTNGHVATTGTLFTISDSTILTGDITGLQVNFADITAGENTAFGIRVDMPTTASLVNYTSGIRVNSVLSSGLAALFNGVHTGSFDAVGCLLNMTPSASTPMVGYSVVFGANSSAAGAAHESSNLSVNQIPFIRAGAPGATGTQFYVGSGIPAHTSGVNNGDFYFRTNGAAGTMIYARIAGVWTAIA